MQDYLTLETGQEMHNCLTLETGQDMQDMQVTYDLTYVDCQCRCTSQLSHRIELYTNPKADKWFQVEEDTDMKCGHSQYIIATYILHGQVDAPHGEVVGHVCPHKLWVIPQILRTKTHARHHT